MIKNSPINEARSKTNIADKMAHKTLFNSADIIFFSHLINNYNILL